MQAFEEEFEIPVSQAYYLSNDKRCRNLTAHTLACHMCSKSRLEGNGSSWRCGNSRLKHGSPLPIHCTYVLEQIACDYEEKHRK